MWAYCTKIINLDICFFMSFIFWLFTKCNWTVWIAVACIILYFLIYWVVVIFAFLSTQWIRKDYNMTPIIRISWYFNRTEKRNLFFPLRFRSTTQHYKYMSKFCTKSFTLSQYWKRLRWAAHRVHRWLLQYKQESKNTRISLKLIKIRRISVS